MEKRTLHSPDLASRNVAKIAELFPHVVTEAHDAEGNVTSVIDFDLLRQELSDHVVEGPQERYRIDWPGKRAAAFTANAPIAKALRPARDDSVAFDTTKNVLIEGDNLDALKILQESYLGKARLIYIDPPYNTGSDLVYHDNFAESQDRYLERSNQVNKAGERLVANTEANGRFHSDWLSMIYPRLRLAKSLMAEDGVILVSIDDAEQSSLRRLMDEVFGERNFVSQLVWEKGRKNDAKFFSNGHEYVLVYANSKSYLRNRGTAWREEKPGAREIWNEYIRLRDVHRGNDATIETDLTKWFAKLPAADPSKKWARYKRVDVNGPWRDQDISWPGGNGPRYEVIHPVTKHACKIPERGWIYSDPTTMQRMIELGVVVFRADHTEPPFRKAHLRPLDYEAEVSDTDDEPAGDAELATQVRGSYFYKQSQASVRHLRDLMGAKVFNNPKDHVELSRLFEYVLDGQSGVVVDFFAGSGTTAEAVFDLCARTGLNCPVVLVQIPERLEDNLKTATGSAKTTVANAIKYLTTLDKPLTITELTKIRIRKAGERVLADKMSNGWNGDVGFRAFAVDTDGHAEVTSTPDDLMQAALIDFTNSIKPDRTGEDLLFQVLLDWGLELTLPIVTEELEGHEIFSVDSDALVACFDAEVSPELVQAIAKREPLRAVFRDSGFASDDARINTEQIFREISPSTDVKAI